MAATDQQLYLQRDQPPGVPPLALTGERTLPDVPEENYWYRRHLVVYEWIRARVGGLRVIDMACGEGYGTACWRATRAAGRRRRRQPGGPRARPPALHAAATALRPRPRRDLRRAGRRRRVPADDRARPEPRRGARALQGARAARAGVVVVSTPNVLTLAPEGAEKSGNPWHVKEYRAEEFRALCAAHFSSGRAPRPVPRAQAARPRARARATPAGTPCTRGWASPSASTTGSRRRSRRATSRCATTGRSTRALDFVAVCRP